MDEQPSLGELIRAVRRELEYARGEDAGNPVRFEVGTVELDLDVEVSKTWQGEGGLDVKVLRAGVSRESVNGSTTRMHVVLTPRDSRTSSGRYEVAGMDTEPAPSAGRDQAGTAASGEPGRDDARRDPGTAVDTEPLGRP